MLSKQSSMVQCKWHCKLGRWCDEQTYHPLVPATSWRLLLPPFHMHPCSGEKPETLPMFLHTSYLPSTHTCSGLKPQVQTTLPLIYTNATCLLTLAAERSPRRAPSQRRWTTRCLLHRCVSVAVVHRENVSCAP